MRTFHRFGQPGFRLQPRGFDREVAIRRERRKRKVGVPGVLVKLYLVEPGSEAVRKLVDAATIVATSSIAYTETRAALARRRRERVLRPKAFASAKKTFETEWPKYLTVEVTSALCRQAGEFAEHYGLRADDSMHLAAFAEVAREAGVRETRFSSFDDTLNRAAHSLRRTLTRVR